MKHSLVILLSAVVFAISCNSSKKTSGKPLNGSNMRANLIDGSWEVSSISNTPKPFSELYAQLRPNVTFSSKDGKVSGQTGCNNFTGKFSMDGSKLSWGTGMAMTHKMCPDMSGEQTFLQALQKVNQYAVTNNGNTLKLNSGETEIMTLSRK